MSTRFEPHLKAYDLTRWGGAVSRTPRAAAATWAPDCDGVHQIALTGEQPLDILVQGLDRLDRLGWERSLFVCLNAALKTRDGCSAPFFFGAGIADALDLPLISVADPTLICDPALLLAWYAGNAAVRDLPRILAAALDSAAARLDARLVIFGPSGGGFAALALADLLRRPATLFVANPQTDIARFNPQMVQTYLDAAFGASPDDAPGAAVTPDSLRTRLLATGIRSDVCSVAPQPGVDILYMQNMSDSHVTAHAAPYLRAQGWRRAGPTNFCDETGRRAMYFGDWGDGHAGLPGLMLRSVLARVVAGETPGEIALALAEGRQRGVPALPEFDPFAPKPPLRLSVTARRADGKVVVACAARPAPPAGMTYAFYLIRDDQRESMRWYRPEPEASFDIPETPGRLSVRAFARDRDGATTIATAPVVDDAP